MDVMQTLAIRLISKDSVILKLARNAKKLDLVKERRAAVQVNEKAIIDLNKEQMRHGIAANGSPFRPYRSREYAEFKASLSTYLASSPTPDLFLTGSYQEAMKMTLKSNSVDINSTDVKAVKLSSYGGMGLTTESKERAKVPVTNTYIKSVATKLRK